MTPMLMPRSSYVWSTPTAQAALSRIPLPKVVKQHVRMVILPTVVSTLVCICARMCTMSMVNREFADTHVFSTGSPIPRPIGLVFEIAVDLL